MAVKRYDGSAWQTVAGLGAQGPAATSSSIATWVKTASGGETSVSGNDDNSQPLSYTVGQELVFINGVLQKRGDDYTATTGNSITGLTALTAGDIVSVWTVNAFSVTNAISNTIMDAKGDLLTASSADVPARLAVGANNTVLTADSSTATGLKWAAVPVGDIYANVATFTSSGTWTVPSGVSHCTVMVVGGGGGGGSGRAGTGNCSGGQGAGGGAIVISYGVPVTPGGSITVTVGAGGAGGASKTSSGNGNNGSTGNTTSFGTLLSAQGGILGNGGTTSSVATYVGFTFDAALTFGTHIYDYSRRSLTNNGGVANDNNQNSKMSRFVDQIGAAGSAGSNGTGGASNANGAAAGSVGIGGGGGAGGGGLESTPIAYDGAKGIEGGGSGGGGAAGSSGTIVGGAGGAGGANTGGGGGGGGVCALNGTPLASGAGGNGGSGFVAIYY